jgi:hypothetical protein
MLVKLAATFRHHLLTKTINTVIVVGSGVVVTDRVAAGDMVMVVIEIVKVTATGFTTMPGALPRRSRVEGVGRGARPGTDTGPPPVGGM